MWLGEKTLLNISLLSWLVALWVAARFAVDFAYWMPAAITPEITYPPNGNALYVFALPE